MAFLVTAGSSSTGFAVTGSATSDVAFMEFPFFGGFTKTVTESFGSGDPDVLALKSDIQNVVVRESGGRIELADFFVGRGDEDFAAAGFCVGRGAVGYPGVGF